MLLGPGQFTRVFTFCKETVRMSSAPRSDATITATVTTSVIAAVGVSVRVRGFVSVIPRSRAHGATPDSRLTTAESDRKWVSGA